MVSLLVNCTVRWLCVVCWGLSGVFSEYMFSGRIKES